MKTYRLVTTKSVIAITFAVFLTIFIFDYFFNLQNSHTLYQNLLFILTFFTLFFFSSMNIGLYYGVKLQDNIGKLTDNIDLNKLPDVNGASMPDAGVLGEGLAALLAIILTIIFAYIFIILSWYFLIFFAAMLYWIYFRALRLVFKHSAKCKNNWNASLKTASIYSIGYTIWLYAVIFGVHIVSPTF
ncbi:hypothetical protein [Sulfuricurvum sp.]|uniref:hypothetical protein n=1 Tax=Sulfuricurvum sp. TaxID=2025608 RepID=UPI002623DFD5|nr:hypothetical protein [Sulfuricurvum sp.]MDD4883012.1 hypothetical protein [Sulfuricurvum sp.]